MVNHALYNVSIQGYYPYGTPDSLSIVHCSQSVLLYYLIHSALTTKNYVITNLSFYIKGLLRDLGQCH